MRRLAPVPAVTDIWLGYNQATIDHGVRDSSSTAYIRPALARGENLDVLLNSQVLRLLVTEHVHGTPSFRTVELATGPEGRYHFRTCCLDVENSRSPYLHNDGPGGSYP